MIRHRDPRLDYILNHLETITVLEVRIESRYIRLQDWQQCAGIGQGTSRIGIDAHGL